MIKKHDSLQQFPEHLENDMPASIFGPMKLLIASRNNHKISEIRAILALPADRITGLSDLPGLPEVNEDSPVFQGNAVKKAMTQALASGMWALADDSGLEVDALNGAPGVRSARYAGEGCDDIENNKKLLKELDGKTIRTARFVCVIALSSPGGRVQTVEGICTGRILYEARGDGGFGYDPLFVPDGHTKTFAELDTAVKNRISHRGKALRAANERWCDILASDPDDWE